MVVRFDKHELKIKSKEAVTEYLKVKYQYLFGGNYKIIKYMMY
jgi:hypothetical protein